MSSPLMSKPRAASIGVSSSIADQNRATPTSSTGTFGLRPNQPIAKAYGPLVGFGRPPFARPRARIQPNDFEFDPPVQRLGVHLDGNRGTDLSGEYVLLSDHFYYFGDQPQPLPDDLLPIVKQGQGQRIPLPTYGSSS